MENIIQNSTTLNSSSTLSQVEDERINLYLEQLKIRSSEKFLEDEEALWLLQNFEFLKQKIPIRNVFAISTNPKEHVPLFFYDKHLGKPLILVNKNFRFRLQFGGARSGTIKKGNEKKALLVRFASKDPSKCIVAHMFTLLQVDSFGSIVDKKDNEKKYTELKQPVLVQVLLHDANTTIQPKTKKRKLDQLVSSVPNVSSKIPYIGESSNPSIPAQPQPPCNLPQQTETFPSTSLATTSSQSLEFFNFSDITLDGSRSDWKFQLNYQNTFSIELRPNHGPPYSEVGIKIKGKHFTPNTRVFWGGCPIASVFVSDTEIWCFSLEGQPGQNVEVLVKDASLSEFSMFTFDQASSSTKSPPTRRSCWADLMITKPTPDSSSDFSRNFSIANTILRILSETNESMKQSQIIAQLKQLFQANISKFDVQTALVSLQERGEIVKKGARYRLKNKSIAPSVSPPFSGEDSIFGAYMSPPPSSTFQISQALTPQDSPLSPGLVITSFIPRTQFIEKRAEMQHKEP